MILLVDNFDSFTYNLVDYFEQLGEQIQVVRNDIDFSQLDISIYKGIVLSPGPETPNKAGHLLDIIKTYHKQKPMLGICLGHQALGIFYGANLVKAQKPMHGKISKINLYADPIFKGIPSKIEVVRYHSLLLNKLPKELNGIAYSEDGEIMGIKHHKLPHYGIQFHPEAHLTSNGLTILKNWASFL